MVLKRPITHPEGTINGLLHLTAGTRLTVEDIDTVAIDVELEEATGLPRGERWLAVRGFRHADDSDVPLCWIEYYIDSCFAGVRRLLPGHTGPILTLIEDYYGITIIEAHEEVTAVLTPPELAAGLAVAAGAPALKVRRTYVTSDRDVALITVNTYGPSRFRHAVTIAPPRN